jgi:FkbM family methyltransferase
MSKFYDENDKEIDILTYETTEQWIADNFISNDSVVLELGGRYGVVASKINQKLYNKKAHVVIEPDTSIISALKLNLKNHSCECSVFNGIISKTPMFFEAQGLASRTRCQPCSSESTLTQTKTLQQLIEETGLQFNTLVVDCEGCLEKFINENITYLPKFKLITFEEDFHLECNYNKIKQILGANRFTCIRPGGHSVWVNDYKPPKKFLWNRR